MAERASRTAVRHPGLTLAAAAATAHAAHAEALSETLAPTVSASPSVSSSAVPAEERAAAAELAAAESAAAEAHRKALSTDVTGGLARLLASVSASDAAFADALRAQGGDA